MRRARAYVALRVRAFDRERRALKEKHLRGQLIRGVLADMGGEQEGRELDFAEQVYLRKLRGQAYLALKSHGYRACLEGLRDKLAHTHPQIIDLPDKIVMTESQAFEATVKPIHV
jgi:hypothetical protein